MLFSGPRKLIIELLGELKGKKHIGNLKMSWYSVQGKFNSKGLTILLKKDMSHKNFTQTHEKISFFIQLANKIMGKLYSKNLQNCMGVQLEVSGVLSYLSSSNCYI